jgi:hypothetical protein
MECPICNFKDLSSGVELCPQCDSDLKSFILLESLKKTLELKSKLPNIVFVLLLLLLTITGYLYYNIYSQNKYLNVRVSDGVKLVSGLTEEIENKKDIINSKNKLIDSISFAKIKYQWITMTIKGGDDIYTLIERVESNIKKEERLRKIKEKNRINNIDFIIEGQKIQIVY